MRWESFMLMDDIDWTYLLQILICICWRICNRKFQNDLKKNLTLIFIVFSMAWRWHFRNKFHLMASQVVLRLHLLNYNLFRLIHFLAMWLHSRKRNFSVSLIFWIIQSIIDSTKPVLMLMTLDGRLFHILSIPYRHYRMDYWT